MAVQETTRSKSVYPESNGKPIAHNTRQLAAIVYLFDNLSALLASREDVFVAADLSWYPVEGHPEIRTAPDVMVVLGRPKGHRPSNKQWEAEQERLRAERAQREAEQERLRAERLAQRLRELGIDPEQME